MAAETAQHISTWSPSVEAFICDLDGSLWPCAAAVETTLAALIAIADFLSIEQIPDADELMKRAAWLSGYLSSPAHNEAERLPQVLAEETARRAAEQPEAVTK